MSNEEGKFQEDIYDIEYKKSNISHNQPNFADEISKEAMNKFGQESNDQKTSLADYTLPPAYSEENIEDASAKEKGSRSMPTSPSTYANRADMFKTGLNEVNSTSNLHLQQGSNLQNYVIPQLLANNTSPCSSLSSVHQLQYNAVSSSEIDIIRTTAKTFLSNRDQLMPNGLFGFQVFGYTDSQKLGIALGMLLGAHAHKLLRIHWSELVDFLIDVKFNFYFSENPYHSFDHVLDITVVLYHILTQLKAERFFNPLDKVILLLAGLCHDIKHPGYNNLFHTNAKTDLSYLYENKSILENFTCSCTLGLIQSKYGFLRNLNAEDQVFFKESLSEIILMTDMAKHFQLRNEFNNMIHALLAIDNKASESEFEQETARIYLPLSQEYRLTLAKTLLHLADISNPCRPFQISKKWSDLVIQEFFTQGDAEKNLGLEISPNMDREKGDQVEIALGFGDFIVGPFIEAMVVLLDADRDNNMNRKSLDLTMENLNLIEIIQKSDGEKSFCDYYLGGLMLNREKWVEIKNQKTLKQNEKNSELLGQQISDKDYLVSAINEVSILPVSESTIVEETQGSLGSGSHVWEQSKYSSGSSISNNRQILPSYSAKYPSTQTNSLERPNLDNSMLSKSNSLNDLSNRRFSVAAGVITFPESQQVQLNSGTMTPSSMYKSLSSRKISYEFSPTGSVNSRENSIASDSDIELSFSPNQPRISPGTYGNTGWYVRSGGGSHSNLSHNQGANFPLNSNSNTTTSASFGQISSAFPPHSRSRRASVEEDQSLRKYLARRRSSNQANNIHLAIMNHLANSSSSNNEFNAQNSDNKSDSTSINGETNLIPQNLNDLRTKVGDTTTSTKFNSLQNYTLSKEYTTLQKTPSNQSVDKNYSSNSSHESDSLEKIVSDKVSVNVSPINSRPDSGKTDELAFYHPSGNRPMKSKGLSSPFGFLYSLHKKMDKLNQEIINLEDYLPDKREKDTNDEKYRFKTAHSHGYLPINANLSKLKKRKDNKKGFKDTNLTDCIISSSGIVHFNPGKFDELIKNAPSQGNVWRESVQKSSSEPALTGPFASDMLQVKKEVLNLDYKPETIAKKIETFFSGPLSRKLKNNLRHNLQDDTQLQPEKLFHSRKIFK